MSSKAAVKAVLSSEVPSPITHPERHFTAKEIATRWNIRSEERVVRIFLDLVPDEIMDVAPLGGKYRILRIPGHVVTKVEKRLAAMRVREKPPRKPPQSVR